MSLIFVSWFMSDCQPSLPCIQLATLHQLSIGLRSTICRRLSCSSSARRVPWNDVWMQDVVMLVIIGRSSQSTGVDTRPAGIFFRLLVTVTCIRSIFRSSAARPVSVHPFRRILASIITMSEPRSTGFWLLLPLSIAVAYFSHAHRGFSPALLSNIRIAIFTYSRTVWLQPR